MKTLLIALFIVSTLSIKIFDNTEINQLTKLQNDIDELKNQQFLAADPQGCVTVYSQCNFEGNSASSCNGSISQFTDPILSVKVDRGMAVSVISAGVVVHIKQSLKCLSTPLNHDRVNLLIKATPVSEIDQQVGAFKN